MVGLTSTIMVRAVVKEILFPLNLKLSFFYYCFDRMLTRTGHLLTIFSQMTKKNASKLSCKFFLCPKQSIFSFRFIIVIWLHNDLLRQIQVVKNFEKSCCTLFLLYYEKVRKYTTFKVITDLPKNCNIKV